MKEASKVKQTLNKAKQHSTTKAVTFPKKNELPQVGLEPTTLYNLGQSALSLSYHPVNFHGCPVKVHSDRTLHQDKHKMLL